MSEPWMHPEREAAGNTGEVPPISPDGGAAGQPAAQPLQDTGPTPAVSAQEAQPVERQSIQQMPQQQQAPQQQPIQQQPVQQEQVQHTEPMMAQTQQQPAFQQDFQQQHQQPPQQQYVPPAQPEKKKKSGMLGLLGLLFVLGGIVAAVVSVAIGLGGIEFSENFFQSLGRFQTASALVFALGFFLWFLGSLLCLIGIAARRGVVAGVIGLFLVIVPSWALGFSMVALAFGSSALLGGFF